MPRASVRLVAAIALAAVCLAPVPMAAQAPAATKTASQAYLEYRAAFEKAKAIEELLPFLAAARRKQVEGTPAADRKEMFEMIKTFDTTTNVKVLKEARTAAGATLTVEGTDEGKKATGEISMVREGTTWKVDKESWKSSAS